MKNYLLCFFVFLLSATLLPLAVPLYKSGVADEYEMPESIAVMRVDGTYTMSVDAYVSAVMFAEYTPERGAEAQKAFAVAARSYALYRCENPRHDNAAVCDNPNCCKAMLSYGEIKAMFDEDYADNCAYAVSKAMQSTKGEYMSFEGKPIYALWHCCSGDYTQSYYNAYGEEIPYLQSVFNVNEDEFAYYETITFLSFEEFSLLTEANVQSQYDAKRCALFYDDSGRCVKARLGNTVLCGAELAEALSLKSLQVSFFCEESGIEVRCIGVGSGLGMSQNGAGVLSKQGRPYNEILEYYYSGITLEKSAKESG